MADIPNPWIPEFEASASDPAVVSAPTQPPAAGLIEESVVAKNAITEVVAARTDVLQTVGATVSARDDTDDIHEIFEGATRLIEDNYRDWSLTQEDDDLYESLKAADQANTRDLPHQDERALLEAIELMPRFLRRTA